MYKQYAVFTCILITLAIFHTCEATYKLVLQTDDTFIVATFAKSPDNTTLSLQSLSNLNYSFTDENITSIAACELFLYFTTHTNDVIHKLQLIPSSYQDTLQKSVSTDNLAIDPFCRSLFFSTPSSLQVSASNVNTQVLAPRILSMDAPGDASISSLSYDYVNYQLLYSTSSGELYQLGFNSTISNKVWEGTSRKATSSAISQSHLYTLEKDGSSCIKLWRSNLTQLDQDSVPIRIWDNSEYFEEFIVTADGEWMFYIDPDTSQLAAMDISTSDQTQAAYFLFPNLTTVRSIRLIPDTIDQLQSGDITNPCLFSKCSHLCLPVSSTESTCYCPDGEKVRTQNEDCQHSQLEGSTLVAATDGIHVLRIENSDTISLSLLPLDGYTPQNVGKLTAAEDRVYWSEEFAYNDIPYSTIRTSSIDTGYTSTIVSETLGQVSGLAVDRLSDNLFWSDRLLRRIEVSRTNGLHRRVLYDNDVIKGPPSNLVADLLQSTLYWVEEVGGLHRILSAPMDSSVPPRVIVRDITSINSLALDASGRLLYWSHPDGVDSANASEQPTSVTRVIRTRDISAIAVDNAHILQLKSRNSTSLFSDTTLLFRYTSSIQNIAHIADDRNRGSSCRTDGHLVCSHLCLPSITGIQKSCVCSVGYESRKYDGVSHCVELKETLYLSQPGSLSVLRRDSFQIFTTKPDLDTTRGTAASITGDVRKGHIYWSDTQESLIGRMDTDGGNQQIIQDGFRSIQGLAFDPLSGNLYWSDNSTGVLGISSHDGSLQKVLIHARDDIPFSLTSNPISGEIYFSTQTSPLAIRSMYGNADNNHQIVRTKSKAQAILFDKNLNEIVWARNASSPNQISPIVQKCTLPYCDNTMTFFDLNMNTYGLAVSPDKFYSAGSPIEYPSIYFLQQHYLPLGSVEQIVSVPIHKPGALYLSHISSQPEQHYCAINNGGCSHFCLLGSPSIDLAPQEYVCECPVHMMLSSDGRNCQPRETFLFVLTEFYILALNKYPYVVDEAVPVGTLENARFVSFDPIDSVIYWVSDASEREYVVKSFGLNKGEMRPSTVAYIDHSNSIIFNFEVEWVGKYAFWTRSNGDSIEFMGLDNEYSGYIFRDISSKPRALAVDQVFSRIFFSDWSDSPSIRSIGLNGKNLTVLVSSEYVSQPSVLTYSHKHNSLFWYDYDLNIIAQYNFSTENVDILYDFPPLELNETASNFDRVKIAVSGDELVWWEKFDQPQRTRFHYFNLNTRSTDATDVTSVGDVYDMIGHTIDPQIHHNSHPCRSNSCKGVCSHNTNGEEFYCTCPLYTYFSSVTLDCQPYECPYVSSCIHGQDCIETGWRCDGIHNCMDGSDEANCTIRSCDIDQFTCNSTKLCIPNEQWCNGESDCEDNSDEIGCMTSTSTILPPTTDFDLDAFEKSYMGILLALVMTVILIFIVCVFVLIIWLICLHRPFYRRLQYRVSKAKKEDLENSRSSPTYSESEMSTRSTRPILDPPMRKVPITRPQHIPNKHFEVQSPDIQMHLDEHYNSAPLCFGYRSAPLSLDVPTVDLVSIVTDQSLHRSEFDYDKFSVSRAPPPSENTNHSSVFLSVSQQDIPAAVESGIPDGTILTTGSLHLMEHPHPNSEISTAITNPYYQQIRSNHLSCLSSHYTLQTTNISSLHPGSLNS